MPLHISLIALRTFVETARLGSMKLAATKLGVTPGAVSQQVKIVEERLGALLFERSSREIQLTEEGLRLMEGLNLPFSHIDEVVRDFRRRKPRSDTLVVTTVPSFASSWLVPRIGSFSEAFPHIEVRVDISVSLVDLRHEPVDVAIRHGSGNYPGMTVTQLFTPKLIVVASPRLLTRFPPINSPAVCHCCRTEIGLTGQSGCGLTTSRIRTAVAFAGPASPMTLYDKGCLFSSRASHSSRYLCRRCFVERLGSNSHRRIDRNTLFLLFCIKAGGLAKSPRPRVQGLVARRNCKPPTFSDGASPFVMKESQLHWFKNPESQKQRHALDSPIQA